VQDAEHRAEEAERRARDARQGEVKVNPHGWYRGMSSTSQIQSLGEEAGLLFDSVEFIVQPSVSTDRLFPTTIEFCSLMK